MNSVFGALLKGKKRSGRKEVVNFYIFSALGIKTQTTT